MRRTTLAVGVLAAFGCGETTPTVVTTPLTAEQKKAIKEADDATDDAERGVDAGLNKKPKR